MTRPKPPPLQGGNTSDYWAEPFERRSAYHCRIRGLSVTPATLMVERRASKPRDENAGGKAI